MITAPYLRLLKNQIDITRVPFSDRGSRLTIFQQPGESRLQVRLAERLTTLMPDLDAYRTRPPFIRDLELIDEDGNPLDFTTTTYPHILYMDTRVGQFSLVFKDLQTLSLGLPPGARAGVHFHVAPQFWEETESGGVFKSIRNMGYASNGEAVRNVITPDRGGYTATFIVQAEEDTAIELTTRSTFAQRREVAPFSEAYVAARSRWDDWFNAVPPVSERFARTYAYAWWVMGNNLISPMGRVTFEGMTPSKMIYVGLWLWDSAIHALAYRHVDPELARNQIRAMLAHQLPDGMLPDAVYDEGVVSVLEHPIRAVVTKPPILAWAALKLDETAPDLSFLQEVYVPLGRLIAWWLSFNDDDGDGLVQYNHPYSSGLDDSPLWDYGMPVESPELNTYMCVQMGSLAVMANRLGLEAEEGMWRRRAAAIVRRMISDFWDPQAGLFWALHDEKPVPVVTPFNLYPLWTGQLPAEIRDRLIALLTDPAKFWDPHPIPTVARDDPHYSPDVMWRGPVWANINYFFIEALQQVGQAELAHQLREKTLELIMGQPSIYEYYNAETGQAPPSAADTFGWTAAIFIDLAIQASREEERREEE